MSDVKDYPPYLDYPKPRKRQTYADRIRAMTDEELAEFEATLGCHPLASKDTCRGVNQCSVCWLDWLKQEAKE